MLSTTIHRSSGVLWFMISDHPMSGKSICDYSNH